MNLCRSRRNHNNCLFKINTTMRIDNYIVEQKINCSQLVNYGRVEVL